MHAPRQAKVQIDDFSFDETPPPAIQPKRTEFRVYLCTTLHDMEEERELLLATVIPAIEKQCTERGVPFSFVDMNIGVQNDILDYDSRLLSGLELVDKWFVQYFSSYSVVKLTVSSTCFIGLFGERYGWHAQYGGAEQFTKNIELAAQKGHKWVSAFKYVHD